MSFVFDFDFCFYLHCHNIMLYAYHCTWLYYKFSLSRLTGPILWHLRDHWISRGRGCYWEPRMILLRYWGSLHVSLTLIKLIILLVCCCFRVVVFSFFFFSYLFRQSWDKLCVGATLISVLVWWQSMDALSESLCKISLPPLCLYCSVAVSGYSKWVSL